MLFDFLKEHEHCGIDTQISFDLHATLKIGYIMCQYVNGTI